jgi:hypothetical protein
MLNKQLRLPIGGGPPAWGLGGGLTTPHLPRDETHYTASDQDGFFGKTTQAWKNGHEIRYLEC